MSASWAATMQASLLAAVARPSWWALALAAFLVRGGFVLVLLPIVSLPTTAALTNVLAPTVSEVLLAGPSPALLIAGSLLVSGAIVSLYVLAFAGSWLDLALLRETTDDSELELGWSSANRSATLGMAVRIAAHLPTVLALCYASLRVVEVLYAEFTSPGDTTTPLALRVLGRAPDAALAVGIAWLFGETIGGLAARRVAAGEPIAPAFVRAIGQVASPRGIATLAVTTLALAGLSAFFLVAASTAWANVRTALLDGRDEVTVLAALVLLVSTWVLGVALLGALLAWRATAWTAQIAPRPPATVTQPMLQASEPSAGG